MISSGSFTDVLKSHPLHGRWVGMINRCKYESTANYDKYGGAGISVCERWLNFENFVKDMGVPEDLSMEIDRKEGDKGYFLENCRWVTRSLNQANKKPWKKDGLPKGVKRNCNCYVARMRVNNISIHIGQFKTVELAKIEHDKAYFAWYGIESQ